MFEFRRLSYLVVLAKRLSYSRAAMELGLSQSALTRAIQSLERDMGMRLFDRDQSGVRLTDQGRWVVAKAEVLLTNAVDFTNQITFAAKGTEGRIRLGLTNMAAHLLVGATLPPRLAKTPRFTHEILIRDFEPLYLMLAQGEIEFFVCSGASSIWTIPDVMPVKIETLGKVPIGLVVRPGHALLSGSADRFPILVSSIENTMNQLISQVCDRMGTSVQIVEDAGILSTLVSRTDAIWLTCPALVAEEVDEGRLRYQPLPDDLPPASLEFFSYSLARRSRSPAASELLRMYSEVLEKAAREPA